MRRGRGIDFERDILKTTDGPRTVTRSDMRGINGFASSCSFKPFSATLPIISGNSTKVSLNSKKPGICHHGFIVINLNFAFRREIGYAYPRIRWSYAPWDGIGRRQAQIRGRLLRSNYAISQPICVQIRVLRSAQPRQHLVSSKELEGFLQCLAGQALSNSLLDLLDGHLLQRSIHHLWIRGAFRE